MSSVILVIGGWDVSTGANFKRNASYALYIRSMNSLHTCAESQDSIQGIPEIQRYILEARLVQITTARLLICDGQVRWPRKLQVSTNKANPTTASVLPIHSQGSRGILRLRNRVVMFEHMCLLFAGRCGGKQKVARLKAGTAVRNFESVARHSITFAFLEYAESNYRD